MYHFSALKVVFIIMLIVIITGLHPQVAARAQLSGSVATDNNNANSSGTQPDDDDTKTSPEQYLLPPVKKDNPTPQPYNFDEFSPWAYFTFRFLAVSVGSFPFTMLVSTFGFDFYKTSIESQNAGKFQAKFLPLVGGADKPPYTSDEVGAIVLTAVGLSLAVGLTDLIIALTKYSRKRSINELFTSTIP